jgi:predicted MPP superfamily phosphohydrolase
MGPLIVPGRYGKTLPFLGHHEHEGLPLFVSRGVGATELPVRTYAPPEVVIVEL